MADKRVDFQLVMTKLNRPTMDKQHIVRPRLLSALDNALNKKLTLISAPAGYGKTTLAAQWLDHIPHPSAWFSLDEHDSEPDCFFKYLIASIRQIFPLFGGQIEPLLFSPTLPPPEYLADKLISDLAKPAKPWVLVIDDFHIIACESVHKMISRLVRYLPDRLHLVIASRVDPPLPLARWLARDWLVEIRAAHLRFNPEEAKAYFGTPFKKKLSDDLIARIAARTEGWVTGLQLARLYLVDTDNPEELARSFSSSDRVVIEYLMDEVIARQPNEIKDFLAVTSLMKHFCASLCEHLMGEESDIKDISRLISILEKENLFLVPLDADGVWYRYHHLFHALLRSRLKTGLPQSRKTQIHHRAGKWFADRGYIEDALRHLITAGDLGAAAELVEQNMHAAIDQDLSRRTLGRWLDLIPKGFEKQRPALLMAHAFQKLFRWDLTGMVPLLDQAESLLKDTVCSVPEFRRRIILGDIALLRAVIFTWSGEAELAVRNGRLGMELTPKQHRYAYTQSIVYTAAATAFLGRMDDALNQLSKALKNDCSEDGSSIGQILVTKIAILSYAVDWDGVKRNAKLILEINKTSSLSDYWLGYAEYFLGSAEYECNALDAAEVHFERVREMRYRVTTRVYHDALVGLALVAWAKADADRAEKYVAMAYSFAVEEKDPFSLEISNTIQIRQTIFSGRVSAEIISYTPPIDSTRCWLIYPSLTLAEHQVNKVGHGDCGAGLESIEKGLRMARRHHNARLEIQFLAVKAVALKCAGKRHQALELLEKTLSRAEPHGLVRSFVDRGPLMAELLLALSEKRSEDVYVNALLDAFGDKAPSEYLDANAAEDPSPSKKPINALLVSGLSNRELDVVLMLSQRLTNKEIAERLTISPITVKSHTINIYRKLNVHNRRQAVVRAAQLGLLNE